MVLLNKKMFFVQSQFVQLSNFVKALYIFDIKFRNCTNKPAKQKSYWPYYHRISFVAILIKFHDFAPPNCTSHNICNTWGPLHLVYSCCLVHLNNCSLLYAKFNIFKALHISLNCVSATFCIYESIKLKARTLSTNKEI